MALTLFEFARAAARRGERIGKNMNTRKRTLGRFTAVLLAVFVLAAAFCLPASAAETTYTLPDTGMTVTLPEGAQLLTADTPADDPVWSTAQVLDISEKISALSEDGILAEIYAFGGDCVIAVSSNTSDYSSAIFNLNNADDETKADFIERMQPASADGRTDGSVEWYDHEAIPFFCIDIRSDAVEEDSTVYERLYGTIFDGKLVSFDLYNGTEEIPEEYDALMRQIVDSAVFSEFMEAPSTELTAEAIWMLVVLVVLLALIIAFFVYRSVVNRRDKREKHAMADRLAAYRQSKLGHEDEGDGALRFVNETEHSDNAIKVFANFHAYRRHLWLPLFTIVIGLVAFYVVWQSGSSDNWWMLLLLGLCIVYSGYKIGTASTTVTKAMIRSYSKMRSRKAAYYFYEGDFRITGLQASNLHPYFQITRMYETKDSFYMYFGEENTYFIAKDGFKQGDAAEFAAFMREKLGKRFK